MELLGQLSVDLVWNGAASRRREIEGSRHPVEAQTADEEASGDVSWGAWCVVQLNAGQHAGAVRCRRRVMYGY